MRDNAKSGALTEVSFFILLALYRPNHGYGIMQFVQEKTEGRLCIGAGSLYGALHSLLKKGWIAPFGGEDPRKKEYILTEAGREIAMQELQRLNKLTDIARQILGGELS